MKKSSTLFTSLVILTLLLACKKEVTQDNSISQRQGESGMGPREGVIFTMSNNATQNTIHSYLQKSNGELALIGSTASGGTGTGTALMSQGALAVNFQESMLFAVNAGSNSISSFHINGDGTLTQISTMSSGGVKPVSLAVHNNLLYVLNAGSSDITGFDIQPDGNLMMKEGSTQALSHLQCSPAQIGFKPGGKVLLVTETATNKIASFVLDQNGMIGEPVFTTTLGQTPIGFSFFGSNYMGTDYMMLLQTWGGANAASTVAMYSVSSNGSISSINNPLSVQQTSASHVTASKSSGISFITNLGSNNISALKSSGNSLQVTNNNAAATDLQPTDIVFSGNESYLYNLNNGTHTITGYRIGNNQKLTRITSVNVPANAAGLVAVNKMFY